MLKSTLIPILFMLAYYCDGSCGRLIIQHKIDRLMEGFVQIKVMENIGVFYVFEEENVSENKLFCR
jgi:hypothetical protein